LIQERIGHHPSSEGKSRRTIHSASAAVSAGRPAVADCSERAKPICYKSSNAAPIAPARCGEFRNIKHRSVRVIPVIKFARKVRRTSSASGTPTVSDLTRNALPRVSHVIKIISIRLFLGISHRSVDKEAVARPV
jgi:hypothetical protein